MDDIDEKYERFVQHLYDSAKKAEFLIATKGRLSSETFEIIRQREAARAAGNVLLTSELAKQRRGTIKKDFIERRAALLVDAAEAGRSNRRPASISPTMKVG